MLIFFNLNNKPIDNTFEKIIVIKNYTHILDYFYKKLMIGLLEYLNRCKQ